MIPATARFCAIILALVSLAGPAQAEPPTGVTAVNAGGTVVTGGTAVTIAARSGRKGGWVMNPCDATESLFVSITGTATTTTGTPNQADLPACGRFNLGGAAGAFQGVVSINAATNGHKFEAVELQ